jgi:hypothetical protein
MLLLHATTYYSAGIVRSVSILLCFRSAEMAQDKGFGWRRVSSSFLGESPKGSQRTERDLGSSPGVSPSSPVGSSFGFFSKKYTRYESIRSDLGDIIRVKAL